MLCKIDKTQNSLEVKIKFYKLSLKPTRETKILFFQKHLTLKSQTFFYEKEFDPTDDRDILYSKVTDMSISVCRYSIQVICQLGPWIHGNMRRQIFKKTISQNLKAYLFFIFQSKYKKGIFKISGKELLTRVFSVFSCFPFPKLIKEA